MGSSSLQLSATLSTNELPPLRYGWVPEKLPKGYLGREVGILKLVEGKPLIWVYLGSPQSSHGKYGGGGFFSLVSDRNEGKPYSIQSKSTREDMAHEIQR